MTDHEIAAAEEFAAASPPDGASAELVDAAKRAVTKWAATRSTSTPRGSVKDRTRVASPKDLAFKALTSLIEQMNKQKLEGDLVAAARRLLPFLKRSSGAHVVGGKKSRPSGAGL